MPSRSFLAAVVMAMVSVVGGVALADEPEIADYEGLTLLELLDQPIVTAGGGVAIERSLAPANVLVFSRQEIDAHGWRSLTEILSAVPGIFVIDDLATPSVGIRGVSGGHQGGTRLLKVMINGVPVNFRPDLTAFLGPEYIPVEAVERVEIARGPLSALYGANAFLATVNVITRRPEPGGHAELAGRASRRGVYKSSGASGMLSYGDESVRLLAAFSGDRIDRSGLTLQTTFPGQSSNQLTETLLSRGRSRRDIASPLSAFLQLSLQSDRYGIFSIQGGTQQHDAMGEFQNSSVLTHKNRNAITNNWASASYRHKFAYWLSGNLTLGWAQGDPTRDDIHYAHDDSTSSYLRRFDYKALDASASAEAQVAGLTLTLGLDATREDQTVLYYSQIHGVDLGVLKVGDVVDLVSDRDKLGVVWTNAGAYLQATGPPFESLSGLQLSGNLRFDKPSLYDPQLSWRTSAAYRFTDSLVTKLIVGRAYQAPSAVLLYGLPGFGTSQIIGNRASNAFFKPLQPQYIHSIEFVTSALVLETLSVEGSIYGQQLNKKIEFVPFGTNFIARNGDIERMIGAELSLRAALGRVNPYLTGAIDRGIGTNASTRALELLPTPRSALPSATLRGGLSVAIPEVKLRTGADVQWLGARGSSARNTTLNTGNSYTLPAVVTLDLQIQTEGLMLLNGGAETRCLAVVRNALNTRYSNPGFGGFDIPSLGRTFYFEVRQSF